MYIYIKGKITVTGITIRIIDTLSNYGYPYSLFKVTLLSKNWQMIQITHAPENRWSQKLKHHYQIFVQGAPKLQHHHY